MAERPILFSAPMVRAILEGASRGRKRTGNGNDARRIVFDDVRLTAMFVAGMTALEIGEALGCSPHPVKKALRRLELSRPANRRLGIGAGENNPAWTGGRRVRVDGYVELWTPNGYQLEHRVVMAGHLDRALTADEVVHHIDANKQNNAIENLKLTTQREHIREHLPEMHRARYGK